MGKAWGESRALRRFIQTIDCFAVRRWIYKDRTYFNSFMNPGTLHCCCRLSGAQPYSDCMAFAMSA